MGTISIHDLEVFYRIGVTPGERSRPQRLLLSVHMETDFDVAARSDSLADTLDYAALSEDLLALGNAREWNLVEKLASDIAELVLTKYQPASVRVRVKKFPLPQAASISVSLTRKKQA